ncbi:transcriptional regulator with XRE-family HTH domain [Curtobacterium sp. 320]|jgi:transcriptional regulator with XRE-family HTH domain|uniref:helix-turn-helix domain-containing protein n=1 Tax=Curtobacterium sp. 320 TaxID=2817749 RepID=UPI002865BF0B|nr:XRE family transcriptional regulator [Curtobacterium sp. 320]MDR6574405.1 transcriptional regulator with XRE-family HTH domain [Curtobacterium sp. 320]
MSHIVDAPESEPETADDADQRRLGERLQRLRTERKWSLTELAEESGVSRAMINRVERGVSSPTATILGRLSGAFGLTVSQLLDESLDHEVPRATDPDDARGVQRGATADSWTDPETGYRRRPISSAAFPADVTEVRLPSGREVAYPASAYAFLRHCIWVVDGVLELVVGGESTRLAAGDRIELGDPADVVYRNPGEEPTRYVVVVVRGQ